MYIQIFCGCLTLHELTCARFYFSLHNKLPSVSSNKNFSQFCYGRRSTSHWQIHLIKPTDYRNKRTWYEDRNQNVLSRLSWRRSCAEKLFQWLPCKESGEHCATEGRLLEANQISRRFLFNSYLMTVTTARACWNERRCDDLHMAAFIAPRLHGPIDVITAVFHLGKTMPSQRTPLLLRLIAFWNPSIVC